MDVAKKEIKNELPAKRAILFSKYFDPRKLSHVSPWMVFFGIYIIVALASMIYFGVWASPDHLIILLLIPIVLIGQVKPFIRDWLPFLTLLFAYEYMRGIASLINSHVHYTAAPKIDMAIWGGSLPTVWLQQHLFNPTSLQWYDYLLTFSYLMHFVAPVIFALILWLTNRSRFTKFTSGFLLLSYAGLTTYLLFPAAPPWMASDLHVIPHITKILNQTMSFFPSRFGIPIPTVYQEFDPNLVAAIPSLHAAYPTIILLFAVRFFRKWGLLVAPYTFSVWVMVIYFGEHYFFDVVLGILYALVAFVAVEFLVPLFVPLFKKQWAQLHGLPLVDRPVESVTVD
jgi:PAP2 superfamily